MNIGIIGGGSVGQTLAAGLAKAGLNVRIGIRNPSPDELAKPRNMAKSLAEVTAETGVPVVSLPEAAAHGEVIFNATNGGGSIAALTAAGADNLAGKVVIDVSNPLDFSSGQGVTLFTEYTGLNSLGEAVQAAFPAARVVKAFNTLTAALMLNPRDLPGPTSLIIAGEDAAAKAEVTALAQSFGWQDVIDLGGIRNARGMEAWLLLWVRLYQATGTGTFNLNIVR